LERFIVPEKNAVSIACRSPGVSAVSASCNDWRRRRASNAKFTNRRGD
jgi:hypothetical protein